MISCDLCRFRFLGDVVCMQCPTGYRINFDPDRHPDVGQTLSITMIFAMSSLRIDGRLLGLRKHVSLGPLLTKSKTTPQTSVANRDVLS